MTENNTSEWLHVVYVAHFCDDFIVKIYDVNDYRDYKINGNEFLKEYQYIYYRLNELANENHRLKENNKKYCNEITQLQNEINNLKDKLSKIKEVAK